VLEDFPFVVLTRQLEEVRGWITPLDLKEKDVEIMVDDDTH